METNEMLKEYREIKSILVNREYKSQDLHDLLKRYFELKKIIEGKFVEV